MFCHRQFGINVYDVFETYYQYHTNHSGHLFPTYWYSDGVEESLQPRLGFLKSEIKDLKRLLDLGYTDV